MVKRCVCRCQASKLCWIVLWTTWLNWKFHFQNSLPCMVLGYNGNLKKGLRGKSEAAQYLSKGYHQIQKWQIQRCPGNLSLSLLPLFLIQLIFQNIDPDHQQWSQANCQTVADALRQQLSMDTSRSFLFLVPLQWLDVTGLSDSPESSSLSTHTSVSGRLANNFIFTPLTLLSRPSLPQFLPPLCKI